MSHVNNGALQVPSRTTKIFATLAALCALALLGGCDYFVSPQTRLDRARNHVEQGNHRAALVELKNALQKDPDLHAARLLLADVALWLGDPASADAELKRAAGKVDPAAAADLRMRVDLALGQGANVLEATSKDNALAPARRSMYRGLALLQARGAEKEAEAALRAAVSEDDSLLPAHIGLIEALIAQNRIDAAREVSLELTERHPDSAQVWFTHGVLLARDDSAQALAALERARDLAPKQLDVLRQVVLTSTLIELQLSSRKVADAKASAERLTKLSPGAPITLLMTSRVAMASNDYTTAATELRRAVNGAPRFAQARFMLGVALAAQGNLEQASQELSQVVEIAPEFMEARQLLAQVRMRLDDPDGALQVLVPGLDGDGGDARLLALVDAARVQAGSGAGAVGVLEQALAKSPGNPALEVQLASAYLQAGAPEKALSLLQRSNADSADPRREALRLLAIRMSEGDAAARAATQALLAKRGSDPKIVSLAAAFYARLGDPDAARSAIEGALGGSRAPELFITLAEIERGARRPAAARAALEKALALDPKHAPARLALAELELVEGDRDAARAQLEQARAADKQAIAPRLLLARIALADQNPRLADELIGEAVQAGSDGAEVHGAAGLMYLNYGRYDQAIGHFKTALQSDSSTPPLWLNLGRAQLALNQHGPARESFERALALRPQWIPAEGALAFLDLQLGQSEQALTRVQALKSARPKDAGAAGLVGQVLFAMRRYAESASAFDEAARLQPSAALAADAYRARAAGKLPQPTAPLERWLESHPDDAGQRFLLAEAYTRMGDRAKAIAEYERIVAAHPQHASALNNLAWLYYEQKDPRALEVARRANAAAPSSPAISDTLGWLLVEAGQVEPALPILEKAATQAAPDPEIVYHYGAALVRAGAVDKGVAQLRRLLKDHPSFPSRGEAERLVAQAAGA